MSVVDDLYELLDTSPDGSVRSRENSRLEFKKSFNLGSAAAYMKTIAAFANATGGFIVFGVTDSPRRLVGVDRERFEAVDPVRLTSLLNSTLSPEVHWESGVVDIGVHTLGFIYTHQCLVKPVIATANRERKIQEGQVYYRYRGQSRTANYAELHRIIQERLELERQAWRDHVSRIAAAGPMNVGVLDARSGRLTGRGGSYLISEDLAAQLTFVKEGTFTDYGEPTLKLIGEVQPIDGVLPVAALPLAIHFEEIINSFLGMSSLEPSTARAYLEQSYREDSFYQPFHFFRWRSGLSRDEALEILEEQHLPEGHKRNIQARLSEAARVPRIGKVRDPLPDLDGKDSLHAACEASPTQTDARSILVRALSEDAGRVVQSIDELSTARVLEALSHLSKQAVVANQDDVLSIVSYVFLERFYDLEGPAKTSFRKAVARIDEALYADRVSPAA